MSRLGKLHIGNDHHEPRSVAGCISPPAEAREFHYHMATTVRPCVDLELIQHQHLFRIKMARVYRNSASSLTLDMAWWTLK